jgi:hypothetical protein
VCAWDGAEVLVDLDIACVAPKGLENMLGCIVGGLLHCGSCHCLMSVVGSHVVMLSERAAWRESNLVVTRSEIWDSSLDIHQGKYIQVHGKFALILPLRSTVDKYAFFLSRNSMLRKRTIMQNKRQKKMDPASDPRKRMIRADGRDRAKGIGVVCSLAHRLPTVSTD